MMTAFPKLGLTLYTKTLSNGLTVYVVPNGKVENVYVTFTTKYGSKVNTFIPNGEKKMVTVPDGIAHFLEHKVFEQESGDDPFAFFGKRGADANASTSQDRTTYMFSGPSAFEENIEFLLDFVQTPHFTDENVEKEKGIIKEELLMYEDNPYIVLNEKSIYNSFHENPIRIPIGGTVDSIYQITKEMLYTCYSTFYHPSNMFVVVTGNVEAESVFDIIENNQAEKNFKKEEPIQLQTYKEKDTVKKEAESFSRNVIIPKASVNFKINYMPVKKEPLFYTRVSLFLLFQSLYGATSLLLEQLKKEEIVTEELGINIIATDMHFLFMIAGDTTKPKEFIEKVKKEIEKVAIDEEEFNRKKKSLISSAIYVSDNVYSFNNKIVGQVIQYGEVLNDYDLLKEFTYKKFKEIIGKLDFSNIGSVIIDK
ncbi:MAG: pitrilysin family protein [Bacilli bacterium]|nr:pitrilysin family protein [Bacilli bacterium]